MSPDWAAWISHGLTRLSGLVVITPAAQWSTDGASRWSFSLLAIVLPSLLIMWWRQRGETRDLHERAALEQQLSRALNLSEHELEQLLFETNNPIPTRIPVEHANYSGGLYLGNARNAADLKTLQSYKITHIVNATSSLPNHFSEHATYLRVAVHDDDDQILSKLEKAVEFVRTAMSSTDSNVLVHCQHGVSCSATVVAAFLIREMGWCTDQAMQHMLRLRFIRIFPGLQKQLCLYEAQMTRTPT